MNLLNLGSARCEALKPLSLRTKSDENGPRLSAEIRSRQKLLHRRLVEFVAEAERDGRKRDVAIQVIAIDGDDGRMVQVAPPEQRSVVAREEDERDNGEAPESAGKSRRERGNPNAIRLAYVSMR